MKVNRHTATAQDFRKAAQEHANAFWFWLIVAGICFYFFQWWAAIPAAFALFTMICSFGASNSARQLKNGTYPIPNLNNGATGKDSNEISEQEAQDVVYSFIDLMSEGAPFIGDADNLPHSKTTIKKSFIKHIEHYEAMRRMNEAHFINNGYDQTVGQLKMMALRLDDWHDIAPEDKEDVQKLNQVEGPPPEWALPLIVKYGRYT